ncbi:MAG: hypothetical protein ACRC8Z_03630 [Empedobacter falsenii]
MIVTGIENNYYLSQNDIWVTISDIEFPTALMMVIVKNKATNKEYVLKASPSPDNEYRVNITMPISALFPYPNHININSLQEFEITFTLKFADATKPDQSTTLTKYFVRGGRNKDGNAEWFLTPSEELIVGKWIDFGVTLPGYAKRLQGSQIIDFIPNNPYLHILRGCDFKIIKFLNSLGGYQYYVFESFEIKNKSKSGKSISKIATSLRQDDFIDIENNTERTIEFKAKTPFEIQDVITELISSLEVLMYNPNGTDDNAKWERLKLESNDSIENNYDKVYQNEIKFSLKNRVNRKL